MTVVLIALTASPVWTMKDGSTMPAGFWADEFLDPYEMLTDAGMEVRVATPRGAPAPVQQLSLGETMTGSAQRSAALRATLSTMTQILGRPDSLDDVDPATVDAIYIPGGHGPMEDLYFDVDLGRILMQLQGRDAPIATTCHGSIGLLSAHGDGGQWVFDGYEMTGYTDEEERQGGPGDAAPFTLESRLRAEGAKYVSATPWSEFVVTDRSLISGQNPASVVGVAQTLITTLSRPAVAASSGSRT